MTKTKKEPKKSNLAVIDLETGEKVKDLKVGDLIIDAESTKAFQERKKKKDDRVKDLLTRGIFVQVLHNEERKIEKELKLALCTVLLDLFFCITEKSKNYLIHTEGERKGQKMNLTDIALFLGKSQRQTKRDIGDLVNLEALICEKNPKNKSENFYLLNEKFFTATERKGPKIGFTKVFQDKLKEIRSKLSTNEYGALLKFMRYFHHQTYYLVSNPDKNIIIDPTLSVADNLLLEENDFVLQHLNQKQLAEIIGINENLVKNYVKSYEKAGAMMIHKQHKSHRFIIHPDLMFRNDGKGEDEYTKAKRADFKELMKKPKKKRK